MKKINLLLLLILATFLLLSCGKGNKTASNADEQMRVQTEQQMQEMNRQIGMPAIKNFTERKLAKMIFELRDDENLICYAYLYNRDKGEIGQFLGKCIGFGLPYSVQYTNPYKMGTVEGGEYGAVNPYVIPQADPNGLFMPSGLSATWLMLLDEKGKPHPVYIEPEIIVSPFPLKK